MSILIFEHSQVAGPGRVAATFRDHGLALDFRKPHEFVIGHARGLPADLSGVEGLVILGGPQNVTDIDKHAWMRHEVQLIKRAHAEELPIVGICLGCQLIGHALGGAVAPKEKPCIGFYPISATPAGQVENVLGGIRWDYQTFFSCGQEVATLPPDATLLCTSKHTKHAAFRVGVRTFAFQYHFECDQALIEAIVASDRDDLGKAGTTEGEIRAQMDQQYPTYARLSDRLCVNLASMAFAPLVRA
jgi:GMP synthase-like glutamine amidotransferase